MMLNRMYGEGESRVKLANPDSPRPEGWPTCVFVYMYLTYSVVNTVARKLNIDCSFDILVNGGGSVTLHFQRQPFQMKQVTVMVPWNRLVTMDTVTMVLEGEDEAAEEMCSGVVHDHYNMRPVVLSTWQHTQLGSCPEMSTVIPESQVRTAVFFQL